MSWIFICLIWLAMEGFFSFLSLFDIWRFCSGKSHLCDVLSYSHILNKLHIDGRNRQTEINQTNKQYRLLLYCLWKCIFFKFDHNVSTRKKRCNTKTLWKHKTIWSLGSSNQVIILFLPLVGLRAFFVYQSNVPCE